MVATINHVDIYLYKKNKQSLVAFLFLLLKLDFCHIFVFWELFEI
jgi:hypothetical protein